MRILLKTWARWRAGSVFITFHIRHCTACGHRMAHRKWKEIRQQAWISCAWLQFNFFPFPVVNPMSAGCTLTIYLFRHYQLILFKPLWNLLKSSRVFWITIPSELAPGREREKERERVCVFHNDELFRTMRRTESAFFKWSCLFSRQRKSVRFTNRELANFLANERRHRSSREGASKYDVRTEGGGVIKNPLLWTEVQVKYGNFFVFGRPILKPFKSETRRPLKVG